MNVTLFSVLASLVLVIVLFIASLKLLKKEVLPECIEDFVFFVFDGMLPAVVLFILLWAGMAGTMIGLITATPPTDEWEEIAVVADVDDTCNDDGEHTVIMSNGNIFKVKRHHVDEYSIGDEYSSTTYEYLGFLTQKGEYKKNQ